jgi:hypothetical protein
MELLIATPIVAGIFATAIAYIKVTNWLKDRKENRLRAY